MKTENLFKVVKSRFNLMTMLFLVLGMAVLTSCEDDDEFIPQTVVDQTIVDVAVEAGSFDVLTQAAEKAGLAGFLSTEKNITVFAPTDAAFATLLGDLGLTSLDQIDAATLASILTYHVVDGLVYSKDLSSGAVPSLNTGSPDNQPLSLLVSVENEVMVNTAKVTNPDVMASNGIIHVIDKVLMPPTVVDIAMNSTDFSKLVQAVVKADLVETLNSNGPFTVFAPTNDAFDALFAALQISGVDEVPVEDLTSILAYHVVTDNILSSELSAGPVKAYSGEEFEVSLDGGAMLNGTIRVTTTDIQGTNGVVHVIDAVLVPPMQKTNSIADIVVAKANSEFSILYEALMKADLVGAVADNDAELTVFAPTDDAFIALLSDLKLNSLDDIPVETLKNILLYHVIGSKAMSTDLVSDYYPTLSMFSDNYISMYINVGDAVTINKNTTVTTPNIEADNGVIHVVDKVILPPSVVNIAMDNDNFSTLVQAVVKAGLVETLSRDEALTVFAPTNEAFDALFADLKVSGIEQLTAEQLIPILTYHVVNGNVLSTMLENGMVPTLSGENKLTIDIGSVVKVNDSNVVKANIQGSNGVVHVINKVLMPE